MGDTPIGGTTSAQIETVRTVKRALDRVMDASSDLGIDLPEGPLASLYENKYQDVFLQYPLNLESSEESHWIRFDIQELQPTKLETTMSSSRDLSVPGAESKSFLDRLVSSTAERTSALVTTALLFPLRAAESVVNNFVSDLPPVLGEAAKAIFGIGNTQKVNGLGSIMLYAPHTRQDTFRLSWKNENIGLTGALFQSAGGALGNIMKDLTVNKVMNNETLQTMLDRRNLLVEGLGAELLGPMIGNQSIADISRKTRGVAWNPHLEMFFQNVEFRTFTFDFRLAPRNPKEAKQIQDIVHLLKYSAAPGAVDGPGGVFFAYPNVFDISVFNEDQTHKVARSALTSVSANHSAVGVNSTFYDNYPVETSLSLTFTELEIMHKKKIGQGY